MHIHNNKGTKMDWFKKRKLQISQPQIFGIEKLEERQLFSAVPVAIDDVSTVSAGGSLTIDYLTLNDTDADGHALSVISVGTPSHGSLLSNGGGSWTYTPTGGYTGDDSFTYVVGDGIDGTDTGTISISVNATFNAETARDEILAGVTTLTDPTGPGYMVAYGPTAYSISNYPGADLSQPMIAAATMGQGRVIAMGDAQWMNMNTHGGDTSMGNFYENSVSWTAGTTSKSIKVVTYTADNTTWLTARGYTNVVTATSATLAAELATADAFVAGWMGSNVSAANMASVTDFVKDGGGLMINDYGIGYDWWWGKDTPDIPGNIMLRDAGIAFTKDWPGSGAQAINRGVGQMDAELVMDVITNPGNYTQAQKDQASGIYDKMNSVLANSDTLQARLDEVFWNKINTINPSPGASVSDSFEKALLKREMDLIGGLAPADVTAHRTAAAVYGAIPAGGRLSNYVVGVNTNKSGWWATGMYAAPGELVTVTVPASLVGQGYSIRINGHVDNISGRATWDRVPYSVSRTFALDSATVQIANAFGGAIYIDTGNTAGATALGLGNLNVTIDGAIEAPYFVLGQTTDAQWNAGIRNNPGAYTEFVSDNLAFSVPSSWIRTLDNPTALMTYWNDAVAKQDWVSGHEDLRTGPERINVDVQISVGLLHAGYPIQGPTWASAGLVDYDQLISSGDWGYFHELGHEMQRRPDKYYGGWDNHYTFSGDIEVTVNITANAALEEMAPGTSMAGWGWSAHPDEVMRRGITTAAEGGTFDAKSNPYAYYFQLADGFGWGAYRTTLQSYKNDIINNPSALPTTNAEEKDQWLIRFSQATGYDLRSYMVGTWGLTVSAAANTTMDGLALPDWMPAVGGILSDSFDKDVAKTINVVAGALSYDSIATLTGVTNGSNGTVVNNGNGTLTYTPNTGFDGIDEFTYTITSSTGAAFTQTLKIVSSNHGVLMETFNNITGTSVSDLTGNAKYPASPDATATVTSFESPSNSADNYGLRMRAYIEAPATGNYTFWIASDDSGELHLSTDTTQANASLIASVNGYTSSQQWDKYASQKSVEIALIAGQKYYIEALMKEGGGGDNLAVGWSGPGISGPTVIDGQYLKVFGSSLNTNPVAVNDVLVTNQDVVGSIDPRVNDTDADSDPLTVTAVTQGTNGSVTFTGTQVTYTPNTGYSGADTFTYTISDGNGGSDTATISVTVNAVASAEVLVASMNEGTGTTISDSSGNGNTGTVTNTAWGAGFSGGAGLGFNGTNSSVSFGTGASLSGQTDFTISAWVRTTATAEAVIIQQRDTGYNGEYMVKMSATGTISFMLYGNSAYQYDFATTTTVNDGQWHHVTVQRQATAGRIYIDGVESASATGTIRDLDATIGTYLGADVRDSNKYFNGNIDEVHIYSQALTPAEIVTLAANSNVGPTAVSDVLVTDQDVAGSIDPRSNDTDPETHSLTVTGVTQGTSGSVTFTDTGVTYTPNAGYSGVDTFTYTIIDGFGGEATGTVNVTVNATIPTLSNNSFESGLTDWTTYGTSSIETSAFGSTPPDSTNQALVTTSTGSVSTASMETSLGLISGSILGTLGGNPSEGSALSRTITVTAGTTLTFSYNYLTNESANQSTYNDSAFFSVSGNGLNVVQELADTSSTLSSSSTSYPRETGYQTHSYTFTNAGTYTIGMGILDLGDATVNSGLLLDLFLLS